MLSVLYFNYRSFVLTAPKVARIGTPYIVSVVLTEPRNAAQTGDIVMTRFTHTNHIKTQSFTIDQTGNILSHISLIIHT